jgi:hypothetical protein
MGVMHSTLTSGSIGVVTTEPSWPVFCLDGPDVIVVSDPDDVPIALDPVLVDEPIVLMDAKGRRLRKVISEPRRRRWFFSDGPEIVGVEVVDGHDDSELLRRTLSEHLAVLGVTNVEPIADMEAFARMAATHIR